MNLKKTGDLNQNEQQSKHWLQRKSAYDSKNEYKKHDHNNDYDDDNDMCVTPSDKVFFTLTGLFKSAHCSGGCVVRALARDSRRKHLFTYAFSSFSSQASHFS